MSVRCITRLLFVIGFAAVATGCASIQVDSDWDPEFDFTRVSTWNYGPDPMKPQGTPILDDDGLLDKRVRKAIEKVLPGRGLTRDETGPDLKVSFFLVVEDKVDVTTINNSYGYGPGWGTRYGYHGGWGYGPGGFGSQTVVDQYKQGTLIIDISVEHGEGPKLVWRGSGSARLSDKQRTPQESEARALEAVTKIFENYPPPAQ